MQTVNQTVLRMINNKKYPLCPQKVNRIRRNKEKYHLSKLATTPNQLTSSSSPSTSLRTESPQRSMGEYFQACHIRQKGCQYRASEELEAIYSGIDNYLWERRQQLAGTKG